MLLYIVKKTLWRFAAPILAIVTINHLLFDLPVPTNKGLSLDVSKSTMVFVDMSLSYLSQFDQLSTKEQKLLQGGFYPLHVIDDQTQKAKLLSFAESLNRGYKVQRRFDDKQNLIVENYIMPSSCYYGLTQQNGVTTLIYFGDVVEEQKNTCYVATVQILREDHNANSIVKLLYTDKSIYQELLDLTSSLAAYGNPPTWVESNKLHEYGIYIE